MSRKEGEGEIDEREGRRWITSRGEREGEEGGGDNEQERRSKMRG